MVNATWNQTWTSWAVNDTTKVKFEFHTSPEHIVQYEFFFSEICISKVNIDETELISKARKCVVDLYRNFSNETKEVNVSIGNLLNISNIYIYKFN